MGARALGVLVCALSSVAADALGDALWEERGVWTIMVGDDKSCFATRTMGDGTEVRLGTDPANGGGYFAIYNPEWTGIEDGEKGTVEFDFGSSRFGGESEGDILDGVPGGFAFFNNPDFIEAFASGRIVNVRGRSSAEFELDLTGTRNAVNGVFECQEVHPIEDSETVPSESD